MLCTVARYPTCPGQVGPVLLMIPECLQRLALRDNVKVPAAVRPLRPLGFAGIVIPEIVQMFRVTQQLSDPGWVDFDLDVQLILPIPGPRPAASYLYRVTITLVQNLRLTSN